MTDIQDIFTEEDIKRMQEEAKKHQEDMVKAIKNMSPEDVKEMLELINESTSVVVEGYNYATSITEAGGMALATIMKLRDVVTSAYIWMEDKYPSENKSDDTSEEVSDEEL